MDLICLLVKGIDLLFTGRLTRLGKFPLPRLLPYPADTEICCDILRSHRVSLGGFWLDFTTEFISVRWTVEK